MAAKPAFRAAWIRGQHCIIPAEAIWEPDWRSGRCVWTRIDRADGKPMVIAGLWSWWRPLGGGQDVHSFTMLTINADTTRKRAFAARLHGGPIPWKHLAKAGNCRLR